ncbi:fumarylacetoacetate hydrolase family protein [Bacillus tianshenii]|nr:fumarylacetoacetate hydrolase family protein [Bacillus tianshenii]
MRFVTATKGEHIFIGILDNESKKVLNLQEAQEQSGYSFSLSSDIVTCLEQGEEFLDNVRQLQAWALENSSKEGVFESLETVDLLAPIPRPRKNIFCIGKNYAAHAIEMGSESDIPSAPMVFSKAPTAVTGPNDIVLHHRNVTKELDYEGELAVVIGKHGKGISKEDAMDYVFGYTILNDITARDLQARHKQFLLGKSMDTSCPMGPYLVHKSLVEDPHNLKIETRVNGEVRQTGNTSQFIFDIPTLISVLSQATTLEPGDIIATGTPAGVGKGFKPPKYLQPGDKVEIEVEKIGTLVNMIEAQ